MKETIRAYNINNRSSGREVRDPIDGTISFSDTVFGFLDELQGSSVNSEDYQDEENEVEDENYLNFQENKAFWVEQDQLLQATLYRTSSIESKIRHATKEALEELSLSDIQCTCLKPMVAADGCRNCLRRELCNKLLSLGYNCAICTSKWKSSSQIPSGEHTYLEVAEKSSGKRGEIMRVVIEMNFRAEFEMARANEEYKRLISRLPEVYVGKAERLRNLIKILCSAAKACMKKKKMHLGPWRKHNYMQAKWLGTCERSIPAPPLSVASSNRPPKQRASMLTSDLLENLPDMHCTAVEVV